MLKTYSRYIGITFCLLFIQTSAMLPLGNNGIRPDLVLFLVLCAAVVLPPVHCACTVFIIGFALESLSGSPIGLLISTYLLISATINLLRRFYNFNTLFELFGLLLLSLIAKYLILSFFLCFIYEYHYSDMFQTILRESLFTIILFPLVFPVIQKAVNRRSSSGPLAENNYSHGA